METKKYLIICIMLTFFTIGINAQNKIIQAFDNKGNQAEKEIIFTKVLQTSVPEYYKETLAEQVIKVYPNFLESKLSLEILNRLDNVISIFSLYDVNGKLLQQIEGKSDSKIVFDLNPKTKGDYLLKIQMGDEISFWKIIKR